MKIAVLLSRILVGGLFIFSGLIKANDPVGFSIKLDEYFAVFGMDWLTPASLVLSIAICVGEIVLGVALFIGARIKLVSWLLLGMIIFFTWLTGYSAVTGSVTDCGCFGDAIKLTPWESFSKDIVLLVLISIIFWKHKLIKPVFSVNTNSLILSTSTALFTIFCLYCLWHLPVQDFRAYKVGANIPVLMTIPDDAPLAQYKTIFTLKNKTTSAEKEFENDLPGDYTENWEYISRTDKMISEGYKPLVKDFAATDAQGNDYTDLILENPAPMLWIISHDLKSANLKVQNQIVQLTNKLEKEGVMTIGLTASPAADVDEFIKQNGIQFPYYFMDATTLKTIVRANPGIVLVKNGVVMAKWHHSDLPSLEQIKKDHLN
jgi:uncharacterized membrane protein YphA (DoxX/SURF4 family)